MITANEARVKADVFHNTVMLSYETKIAELWASLEPAVENAIVNAAAKGRYHAEVYSHRGQLADESIIKDMVARYLTPLGYTVDLRWGGFGINFVISIWWDKHRN